MSHGVMELSSTEVELPGLIGCALRGRFSCEYQLFFIYVYGISECTIVMGIGEKDIVTLG